MDLKDAVGVIVGILHADIQDHENEALRVALQKAREFVVKYNESVENKAKGEDPNGEGKGQGQG